MTHLETELIQLKNAVVEMLHLTKTQLEKSQEAFLNIDTGIAQEIVHNESRVNAMELSIDRSCENIFALFNPVATDLRFVISMLKINSDIERIGDNADGIADYVFEIKKPFKKEMLEAVQMHKMFTIAISMVGDVLEGLKKEDTKLVRKVFQEDHTLNQINNSAARIITEFIQKDSADIRHALFLFSTIKKLERVGDHVKNIAEDVIFYLEAVVLKHKSKTE